MSSLPESTLFDDLSEADRIMIARFARRRKAHDELIVRRGEKASHLFVLVKGRVKYYRVTKKGHEVLGGHPNPANDGHLKTGQRELIPGR